MKRNFIGLVFNNYESQKKIKLPYKNKVIFSIILRYEYKCITCGTMVNLIKCICKEFICVSCLKDKKNQKCIKDCYLLNNQFNYTTYAVYNISKHPLPKNFEAELLIKQVGKLRI